MRLAIAALLAFVAIFVAGTLEYGAADEAGSVTVDTYVQGRMLYIQSRSILGTALLGLDQRWGGAITVASLDGTNYVNSSNAGREVQPALWDGAAIYAGDHCSKPWGWNAALAGDRYRHGSPVLAAVAGPTTLSTKTTPLQWCPNDKGGGPSDPVVSDAEIDQTVSVVPGAPQAFKIHVTAMHLGADQHYNRAQEFPAVYSNAGYDELVYYSGTRPWTSAPVTKRRITTPCCGPEWYSSEEWESYVNESGMGLTIYVPGQYPYVQAFSNEGIAGDTADATNYFTPFTPFTFGPHQTMEYDMYLIVGPYEKARAIVYDLHAKLPPAAPFTPYGSIDRPAAGATASGTLRVNGWAIDRAPDALSVHVFVDGIDRGRAAYGTMRPDIPAQWPHAPANVGFNFPLDTTTLSNGQHTIEVHATGKSHNTAIFPPITFNAINPR
jgi:hypothetical protein